MLNKTLAFVGETLYNIIIILVIVVVIRSFIISPFHVSGRSMVPTLQNNDYIIIDKFSKYFDEFSFQDVVVFTPPNPRMRKVEGLQCTVVKASQFTLDDSVCVLPDFFIKRIIGVPGDVIEIENGEVIRNGEILAEEYLDTNNNHKTYVPGNEEYKKYVVPKGKYFVLGDNRNGSSDSRAEANEWINSEDGSFDPFVSKDDIQGKYFFTLISPNDVRDYFMQSGFANDSKNRLF